MRRRRGHSRRVLQLSTRARVTRVYGQERAAQGRSLPDAVSTGAAARQQTVVLIDGRIRI